LLCGFPLLATAASKSSQKSCFRLIQIDAPARSACHGAAMSSRTRMSVIATVVFVTIFGYAYYINL
jgi:hypothetical protein